MRLSFMFLIQLLALTLFCDQSSAFAGLPRGIRLPSATADLSSICSSTLASSIFNSRHTPSISQRLQRPTTLLSAAVVSQQQVQKGVDIVVAALRKDKTANEELGRLQKVNNILGFGSPSQERLLLRFNASFQRGGFGRSSIPMPFGLGQTNKSEGRGTMVGQVKAEVMNGKVVSCSVFRDLGYGRSFNLKC